jgi:hypothetical protein
MSHPDLFQGLFFLFGQYKIGNTDKTDVIDTRGFFVF